MKLLLDTHVFMWWDSNPANLSPRVLAALRDPANTKWISVVSIWEMVIKNQLGKLILHLPLAQIVAQQQANGLQILEVALAHVLAVEGLPSIHKDPFDRLLVAQSNVETAELVTADPIIARYPGAGVLVDLGKIDADAAVERLALAEFAGTLEKPAAAPSLARLPSLLGTMESLPC